MELVNFKFVLFIAALIFSFIEHFECILYNKFSGRCIHIKSSVVDEEIKSSLPVQALPCSWSTKSMTYDTTLSNFPEDWIEIVPVLPYSNGSGKQREYTIRNVNYGEEICMISKLKRAMASTSCATQSAKFELEFKSQINKNRLQGRQFKIRNEDGLCLTAELGKESLPFKECTQRHSLLQHWLVCRHNQVCDVDITWTPRKIEFVNRDEDRNLEGDINVHDTSTAENSDSNLIKTCNAEKYYRNEVLYSIQNGLEIFGNNEEFLVSSLASFYPTESLLETLNMTAKICQEENLICAHCHSRSWRKSRDKIALASSLVAWMEHCNSLSHHKVEFLSRHVLLVPQKIFPPQDQALPSNPILQKTLLSVLKKYVGVLEAKLKMDEDEMLKDTDANDMFKPNSKENRIKPNSSQFVTHNQPKNLPERNSTSVIGMIESIPSSNALLNGSGTNIDIRFGSAVGINYNYTSKIKGKIIT